MRTVYIDVGARCGTQINMALPFVDIVYGFEPSPTSFADMEHMFDDNPNVQLFNAGLWDKTCEIELINDGAAGGTIFQDYKSTGPVNKRAMAKMIRASEWFSETLTEPGKKILKLNCEGCECDILNDLIDSGEFWKLHAVLVDFDVRKCPSKKHEEDELKNKIRKFGIINIFPYMMCNDGTPMDRKILWRKVFGEE